MVRLVGPAWRTDLVTKIGWLQKLVDYKNWLITKLFICNQLFTSGALSVLMVCLNGPFYWSIWMVRLVGRPVERLCCKKWFI